MFHSGLLILTQPVHLIRGSIPVYLSEINRLVCSTLYVHIQPATTRQPVDLTKFKVKTVQLTPDIRNIVKDFYSSSANSCSKIDVRVLLGHISNTASDALVYDLKSKCDVVLVDQSNGPFEETEQASLLKTIQSQFNINPNTTKVFPIQTPPKGQDDESPSSKTTTDTVGEGREEVEDTYDNVVLGGTFDRLHTGHKILLSDGIMLSRRSLTVGVTDGDMNAKKTLRELIQPTEVRIELLREFLTQVQSRPDYRFNLVPITDMFGPTVTEPELDCIIVSQETKKGGDIINTEREKRGMKKLAVYVIELVEDQCHSQYEEVKVSSSSARKRLLGTVVNPLKSSGTPVRRPYIIGLTGGIASGKSAVCKRLEGLGAVSIDCDKLGHRAYVRGSPGFKKVVEAFGQDIVGEDGEVNRRALGAKVFSDKHELQKLNGIVWPEIGRLAQEEIKKHSDAEVLILEAALLLEAGWDSMVQEVWATVIPTDEAIKRMVDRNNLTEDQARQRIQSQITNENRVKRSNIVLCTLWEYEYTQQQVEKAWALLQDRIKQKSAETSSFL